MYRFLIVKSVRKNYEDLYQYLTTKDEDGNVVPVECEDEADMDVQVEKMLNEDGYAKSDFIVVNVVNYDIDATNYSE